MSKQQWRKDPRYRSWKKAVVERDGACQSCGSLDSLHAHHIYHATYYPDRRYDVGNGTALCAACHGTFHNDYVGSTRRRCDEHMLSEFYRIRNLFAKKFLSEQVRIAIIEPLM